MVTRFTVPYYWPTVALGDERGVERAVVRHVDSHRVEVEYGCLSYCL